MSRQHRGRTVVVQNGNVQRAIKKLRRRIIQEQVLKQYMYHTHYTKKSFLNKKKRKRKEFLSRLSTRLQKQENNKQNT